ncbi:RNA polymerase sigma factor, partial [Enterobacter hormaechei]|uniref:RNA polymerase sigma factor n=1 Tax=Enterobacter hormaechei TaxID=158836 RepID=UPI003CC60207
KTLLHGDVLMWLMKTLLTSGCTNQRGAGQSELPSPQREVFEKTEFEGYSMKVLAEETGDSVQALLSRKHKAVRFLRSRLKDIYEALTGQ